MKDLLIAAQNYVGIPWKESFGDTLEGMDCYSFARYFLAQECGIVLPRYRYVVKGCLSVHKEIMSKIAEVVSPVSIDLKRPSDIVLMRYENLDCHIAVYLGHDKIIHCDEPESAILNFSDMLHLVKVAHRIQGFYRCK